ncbi:MULTISPECIES: MFS transporter [unclassified Shinella]|uniref:MFS transporter n=1 Tax=unclassified Shinella TaxID=2643062 RepID=UPI00225CB342|nr:MULTISPECIES: MFS transporter [unclassified Shinella]MCO5141225.1 MFS transporter [Shinella sp.]MDC7260083.1 MFS transporter [Shinella sp. YE25]CAI0341595.1 RhtX/FptX family siderophore transporter [Rhizobiaceae bacterium]CAK7261224.1 RhtX/FptX family siderophore transporter [Shinella sp. WSC3-e]
MTGHENAVPLALPQTGTPAETGQLRFFLLIGALYFTQGLPMGLSMEAVPVLMRQGGASMDVIALVPLAGLPWIIKFLWAPVVDNHWKAGFGRRRSWIVPMQVILAVCLVVLAFLPLEGQGLSFAVVALALGSIASATQDTATDGLAAEQLAGRGLAYANALQIGGMMAGFMVGGGGVLMIADTLGQQGVFLLLALFPALTVGLALSWREPPRPAAARDGDRARLADTFRRPGIRLLLALAFIYGGAHAGGLSVSKIFLVDQGWSNQDTGLVATFSGFVMLLVGCPLGSALTARNRWFAMAAGMALAAISFVLWSLLAGGILPAGWSSVLLAIGVLSVASGFIAVSAATIIMAFGGAGKQAGTDVTVLQSANVLGEMAIAGLVVWVVGRAGYGLTFAGAALLLVLALLFVSRAARAIHLTR